MPIVCAGVSPTPANSFCYQTPVPDSKATSQLVPPHLQIKALGLLTVSTWVPQAMPTILKTSPRIPEDCTCWKQNQLVPDSCYSVTNSPPWAQMPSSLGSPIITLGASVTFWPHRSTDRKVTTQEFQGPRPEVAHIPAPPFYRPELRHINPSTCKGAGEQRAVCPGIKGKDLGDYPSSLSQGSFHHSYNLQLLLTLPRNNQAQLLLLHNGGSSGREERAEEPPSPGEIPTSNPIPSHPAAFLGSWLLHTARN